MTLECARRLAPFEVGRLFSFFLFALILAVGCSEGEGGRPAESDGEEDDAPPVTDLFLVDLDPTGEVPRLGEVRRLTDRDGYDNQPAFHRDGLLMYTSRRGEATDIYGLDLATGESTPLTQTPENDWSPIVVPGRDGFATVRQERDETQRMWWIPRGEGEHELLLRWNQYVVGYHAWFNEEIVAVALVHDTLDLSFAHIPTSFISDRLIDVNIGRCLARVPLDEADWVSYVSKGPVPAPEDGSPPTETEFVYELPGDGWWLRRILMGAVKQSDTLILMPENVEDYAWTPDAGVITSDGGSTLLFWNGEGTELGRDAWIPLGDLADQGVRNISRMAVHPAGTSIVVVGER